MNKKKATEINDFFTKEKKQEAAEAKSVTKATVRRKTGRERQVIDSGKTGSVNRSVGKIKEIKRGNKISLVFLVALLVGSFFLNGRWFWQGPNFAKTALVISGSVILIWFYFWQAWRAKKLIWAKNPLTKYLVLGLVVYILSTYFSVDRWHSLVGFVGNPSTGLLAVFSGVLLALFLPVQLLKKQGKTFFWLAIILLFLFNILLLIFGLNLWPWLIKKLIAQGIYFSLFGSAVLVIAGLPLFLSGLFLSSMGKKKLFRQIWLIIAILVAIINILILQSFILWSGLLAGLVIFSFLMFNAKSRRYSLARKITMGVLILTLILSGLIMSGYQGFLPQIARLQLPAVVKVGGTVSYDIFKNILKSGDYKQILLGSGPATYAYDFAKFRSAKFIPLTGQNTYFSQGDGLLGELFPTLGLLGVLVFVGGIVALINFSFQRINKTTVVSDRFYLIGLLAAVITWLMGVFLLPLDAGTLFSGGLITMILLTLLTEKAGTIDWERLPGRKIGIVALILFFVGGGLAIFLLEGKLVRAEMHVKQAQLSKEWEEKVTQLNKAIALNPAEGVYQIEMGQVYLSWADAKTKELEALRLELLRAKSNQGEEKNIKEEEKEKIQKISLLKDEVISLIKKAFLHLERGATLLQNNAEAQWLLGEIALKAGDLNKAEEIYTRLLALEPNNARIYFILGDLQMTKAQQDQARRDEYYQRAEQYYRKAQEINPAVTAEALYKLAITESKRGNLEKALQNIEQAVKLQPNNFLYNYTWAVLLQASGDADKLQLAKKILLLLRQSNPVNVDVLAQLGALYEQEGKLDLAKKQYQLAKQILIKSKGNPVLIKSLEKMIENLNQGKTNILPGKEAALVNGENNSESNQTVEGGENLSSAENNAEKEKSDQDATGSENWLDLIGQKVRVTVTEEGPINVRSAPSLTAEKITKIKESGEFKLLAVEGDWVQILIPASDNQGEQKGWIHQKFVNR